MRVPLHGRRVRGWVIANDVEPETASERLRPLVKVVSAGPPPDVVELCRWIAWRYAGPWSLVLRAASPPNVVFPVTEPRTETARYAAFPVPAGLTGPGVDPVSAVAWPPATNRRDLVLGLLATEGSTIVVVPDSARLDVLLRLLHHEHRRVVVAHSDRAASERTADWDRARAGACVVVGGRLAVLAPVPDLQTLVVLDEGDEALKEERAPAWHAREVAVERGHRLDVPVTLVAPAPGLEAQLAAGGLVRPARRIERDGWPALEVVDPRDEPPGAGVLTARLASALREALESGRAVCVLNRRGRARLLACVQCQRLARCETCGAAVVESHEGLGCPRCGTQRPRVCLHCHGTRFRSSRVGVTGVRDQLAALLPRARVGEVDAATTEVPDAEVLIGTEAVLHRAERARGRPVRLVAFLDFDQELLAPRYRAAEQALTLLARAARLVGGRAGGGRVIVQTRVPDHEVLEAARRADPARVAGAERTRRRALRYPPFGGLAELSGTPAAVSSAVDLLSSVEGLEVTRPGTSTLARVLLRAATPEALSDALAGVDLAEARALGRLRVEVEPLRV